MKIKPISKIQTGQDGAIFGEYLFRFDNKGRCNVYLMSDILAGDAETEIFPISKFTLDRADEITPHCNAVVFGKEYFEEGDEFPILYSNIYNTYKNAEDKMCGTLCAYRITRCGDGFTSLLVQIIEVGFTDSRELWRSSGEVADVRPYGNFVVDNDNSKCYAYVMRDGEKSTRYFRFAMPTVREGKTDARFGVPRAVLSEADIEEYFDVPYHNYIQGGVYYGGKIYEVEGFGKDIRSAIRVINCETKSQELYFDFYEAGYGIEPECIDFYKGKCIYSDGHGNVFELVF